MENLLRAGLAALAYFASARLGYAFAIPQGVVTLWPPSGVILGLLLLSERRHWAALLIGAFVGGVGSDLLSGATPAFALAAAVANSTESLLAAWVVTWRLGPQVRLSSLRAVLVFMGGAVLVSNAVTAILGALVTNHGVVGPLGRAWTEWWVGDGLGMLIVAPVLLGWAGVAVRLKSVKWPVVLEAVVLIALLVATAVVTLGPQHAWPVQPGPYATFPLLIWAALRFGPSGAATASLILAAVALWNAALGVGPFASAGTSGLEVAVQVYVYLTVASLTSLIPAAVLRERRAAELHLHSSEDRYRELFEANPQPTMVYDLETLRFLAVNQAAVEKYGYSREEFRSLTIKDIRPAEDVPALLERVSHLRRPERIEGQLWRHCRKDGSVMEVEVLSSAIEFDGHGARLVLVNDVTERRRTELTLRESEERFRQMAEHIQEAFYVIDLASGVTLYISPTWATIWGRPIEDGRDPFIWLNSIDPDDQTAMRESRQVVMRGETSVLTFRVIRPDGSLRWVLARSFPVRDDTGRVYRMVGVASDITEIRQVQEQFVQAQKMEAVGRLAGGVAHDFNNLLTVILSWTAILLEKRGQDGEELEMLREIGSAGERAAGLTRQLLAFSRKQVLAPRVLDLNALIADTEKFLRRLIGEDIELRTVLVPGLGTALADPGQVEQVIMNLVVNARDAMPNGGTLTIRTANADMRDEPVHLGEGPRAARYVMVAVGDTGVGMDAETQAHLFEPFFTTKGVGKGTGLGLATVYGIVQQSGGFIRVESEAGAGTTFKLYWPVVERAAVVKESASGPQATLRGTETVLVVEDDEQIRNLTRTILTARGYSVLVAENGEHALALAAEHEGAIHLMLTDVIMPGMSGRELADRLNAAHPAMRVLYASGYTDEMIAHHGVLEPGVDFLQKPFTPGDLAQRVRDALDAEPRPG